MTIFLAGCGSSDIATVKNASLPDVQTHTYESALSGRASCESEEWRTFKDDSNRPSVEYRCVLKGAPALMASMRTRRINETNKEFQNYYQAFDQRIEEAKRSPAEEADRAKQAQQKLAQIEAEETKANQQFAHENPISAMRRAAIRNEMGSLASARSIAERSQAAASDTASNLERNLASLRSEKERYERDEKNTLTEIERSFGNVTKVTQVFQWVVNDKKVFPNWAGIEIQKQDGATVRTSRNWTMTIRDLLHHRGDDHVHYALDIPADVTPGQFQTAEIAEKTSSSVHVHEAENSKEACYDNKLKGFKSGMGDDAPVSNDMMQEWRNQCGLPPT
ncbi:hypothetical protein [Massilia rhizosphaerae]|uniref:hypothetical protein n=1 Tax=Massilia rhizosphaerae TaxID=2784389 RepID=UPI0018DD30EF|nr:hypothetical protein [Massilia rhizosphaerae]